VPYNKRDLEKGSGKLAVEDEQEEEEAEEYEQNYEEGD